MERSEQVLGLLRRQELLILVADWIMMRKRKVPPRFLLYAAR